MTKLKAVKRPTIYSIGYQKLPDPEMIPLLCEILGADLFDVRSKPVSRKKGFGGRQLKLLLGDRYQWHGDKLGGLAPGVTAEGVEILRNIARPAILMCLEEAPGACHRHIHIATSMFGHAIDIAHIYKYVVIRASYLQGGIDSDSDDYPFNYLEQVLEIGGYDRRDEYVKLDPAEQLNPPFEGPWFGDSDYIAKCIRQSDPNVIPKTG